MESEKTISAESFTCDEELEFLQVGDYSTQVTGVIIKVEQFSKRNSGKDSRKSSGETEVDNTPLKTIFSNMSGMEMRVLFWGPRKEEFSGKILNQVVRITRGQIVTANPQYFKPAEGLLEKEIFIQKHTSVELLGPWVTESKIREMDFQSVELKNAGFFIGQFISVCGFLKTTFASIVKGNSSFASGALTDCKHRLIINITSFDDDSSKFAEGSHVMVKGKLRKADSGTVILQVKNVADVKKISDTLKCSFDMRRGYLPIKDEKDDDAENRSRNQPANLRRKSEDSEAEIPSKKGKNTNSDLRDTKELDDLINRL